MYFLTTYKFDLKTFLHNANIQNKSMEECLMMWYVICHLNMLYIIIYTGFKIFFTTRP